MDETSQFKKISRKRRLLRIFSAISFLVCTGVLFFLFLLASNIISFDKPSFLVVLNLSEKEVRVNDSKLEIFDSYVAETNVRKTYQITSVTNNFSSEKTIPELDAPKLYLYVNADNPYCFFMADVTSFYYETETVADTISSVNLLAEEGSLMIDLRLDYMNNVYLFPGRYSASNLPENLVDRRVMGVYPIACHSIQDANAQKNTVLFYKNFNSSEQRDFFYTQVEPLRKELQ